MRLKLTNKQVSNILNENYNYVPNYDSVQEKSDNFAGVPFSTVLIISYLPNGVTNSDEVENYRLQFHNDIIGYNYKIIDDVVDYHTMIFDIDIHDAYDLMLNYDQETVFYGEVMLSDGNVETVCGNLEENEPYISWDKFSIDDEFYDNFVSPFLDEKECSKTIKERSDFVPIHYKGFEFLIQTIY